MADWTFNPFMCDLCPHREKYSFKPESRLQQYLQTCTNWVQDPEQKYTVNFILLVLLSDLKSKDYITQDIYSAEYFIFCHHRLQAALRTPSPILNVQKLRRHILGHLKHRESGIYDIDQNSKYLVPFWCVDAWEHLISKLFDNFGQNQKQLVYNQCRSA